MPLSTDVKLDTHHHPTFPDRCIGCGAASPRSSYQLKTRSVSWMSVLFSRSGRRITVEVPACEECRPRLRRRRLLDTALNWLIFILGMGVAVLMLRTYQGPFKDQLVAGIVVSSFLPLVIWRSIRPRALDLAAVSDSVTYEFRDRAYAEEFAELNGGEVG
jgi:hypothetical protein